jgi:hypothetical protein
MACALAAAPVCTSLAGVQGFTERAAWEAAVGGEFTTIGFTEYPDGTIITDQYAHLGVSFTDGNDYIAESSSMANDGVGLAGGSIITLAFPEPQAWLAVDFPGALHFELYRDGQHVYSSGNFGLSGKGLFAGLLSDVPFDEVVLNDWAETISFVVIDDFHFGVPAPSALVTLFAAPALTRGRRRSSCSSEGNEERSIVKSCG